MDIVVTGSTGMIGQALVPALEAVGHHVIRAVRGEPPDRRPYLRWSPAEGTIDRAGLEGVHAVVHLAGAGVGDRRWTDERKRVIRQSRLEGTRLLAGTLASLDRPPVVLVSASGVDYYGDRGDELLREGDPAGDGFLAAVCADWEAATAPAQHAGIRVVHTRSGMVLSTTGGALAAQLPFFKLGLGGRIGHGRQFWSWIALDDAVRATMWLLDQPVSGPVNVVSPGPVRQAEFADTLGRVLRRPTVLPTPKVALYALYGRELSQHLVYTSHRVCPAVLEAHGFVFEHPHLEGALRSVLGTG